MFGCLGISGVISPYLELVFWGQPVSACFFSSSPRENDEQIPVTDAWDEKVYVAIYKYGIDFYWQSLAVNIKGILAAPPKATPPRNKGLIRPY